MSIMAPVSPAATARLANHNLEHTIQPSTLKKNQTAERIVNNAKQHQTVISLISKLIKHIQFMPEHLKDIFSFLPSFKDKFESPDLKSSAVFYYSYEIYKDNINEICKKVLESAKNKHGGLFRESCSQSDLNTINEKLGASKLTINDQNIHTAISIIKKIIEVKTPIQGEVLIKIKSATQTNNYKNAVNEFSKCLDSNNEFSKIIKTVACCYQYASNEDTATFNKTVLQKILFINLFSHIEDKELINIYHEKEQKESKYYEFINVLCTEINKKNVTEYLCTTNSR